MPPPRPRPKKHARERALPYVDHDAVSALLAPLVADEAERAFVVRCLLDEGPAHHRGANYVILRLLGMLLEGPAEVAGETRAAPMHLPPHLTEDRKDEDEQSYPLRLPLAPLDRLAPRGSAEQEAMIEALFDGPPQHALANVAVVCLVDALLRRRERKA